MADAWGRSLHGERGLKFPIRECFSSVPGRSLHGERGLKCSTFYGLQYFIWSLPSRGAWIEIFCFCQSSNPWIRRSLHGERGLKFIGKKENLRECLSLPSRGAWIEILSHTASDRAVCVAPFTGSVD